jgi:protein-tyrosine phosphatase
LAYHALAIPDRGVPRSPDELSELVARLEDALASGKNVAVHCRQGIGRSSLLAAALLVATGADPYEAFKRIEEVRGTPVPDTREQRAWLAQVAQTPAVSSE